MLSIECSAADLLDRDVRVWAEECDQMQGIQIFTGGDDAWGGFASKYAESLRDEYGKMPMWAWGIDEEQGKGQRAKQLLRTVNAAMTINKMASHASLYIPMSIPTSPLPNYVHMNRDSQWHTSALLSAALESMTLPSRLRPDTQKRRLLGDIEAALNVNGNQRMAQLECSILAPEDEPPKTTNSHRIRDDRARSDMNRPMMEEDGPGATKSHLDLNLSDGNLGSFSSLSRQQRASDHTFGAVECIRGKDWVVNNEDTDDDNVTSARKQRRSAGLTVVERFVNGICTLFCQQITQNPSVRADNSFDSGIVHRSSTHSWIVFRRYLRYDGILQKLRCTPRSPPPPASPVMSRLYRRL